MTNTTLLGEYAQYVPHPDDTEEHKRKLQELLEREQEED